MRESWTKAAAARAGEMDRESAGAPSSLRRDAKSVDTAEALTLSAAEVRHA